MTKKVIICGGRNFNDYTRLCREMDTFLTRYAMDEIVIISGHAEGADTLGERYSEDRAIDLEIYLTNWERDGKQAEFKRNTIMVEKANAVVAFWDGMSKGTLDMITKAQDRGLDIKICMYTT